MQDFSPEQALWGIRREFGEHGGVAPSISRSSTFTVMDPDIMPDIFKGVRGPHKGGYFLYSRHFNPTVETLSREIAAMEDTKAAICTASGMSAIACTLMQLCKQGDHIVSSDTIYGGTYALFDQLFPELGISTTFVDPGDTKAFEDAAKPQTRVFYTEIVGNPTLRVADIQAIAEVAKSKDIKFVIDNTFTPMLITPSRLGADIVVHSLTKFVNGASDVIAGAICGSESFILELMDLHKGRAMLFGPTMDARVAFDIQQRLPHLATRMKEHSSRALAIAEHLEKLNLKVSYPGLASHPQHELIRTMTNKGFGFGGILTIDCGTREKANLMMENLQNKERFGLIAVSLGYYDTLMSVSSTSTSSEISEEDQQKMGLSPGLLRLSIGITGDLDARIEQIERATKESGLI